MNARIPERPVSKETAPLNADVQVEVLGLYDCGAYVKSCDPPPAEPLSCPLHATIEEWPALQSQRMCVAVPTLAARVSEKGMLT